MGDGRSWKFDDVGRWHKFNEGKKLGGGDKLNDGRKCGDGVKLGDGSWKLQEVGSLKKSDIGEI